MSVNDHCPIQAAHCKVPKHGDLERALAEARAEGDRLARLVTEGLKALAERGEEIKQLKLHNEMRGNAMNDLGDTLERVEAERDALRAKLEEYAEVTRTLNEMGDKIREEHIALKIEVEQLTHTHQKLIDSNETLRALVLVLKTGLRYYARPEIYEEDAVDVGVGEQTIPGSAEVMHDRGDMARRTLGEEEG